MEEDESVAAEEEYSNECSNYSEDEEEAVSIDGEGAGKDDTSPAQQKGQSSDTKTNGSLLGDARTSSVYDKFLEERKEVTYSAYGINLESTLKLLACSKNVSLVGKSDIKAKRMFVTSVASIKE